ncbi:pogo transposable element with ZNF domain isoform X1 [Osmerus mordax]|uniref:pogo transposable element with ZNF domain isoform X1 n=1 Tax=Osmerus mordax TaxID=8014 RepID=UPI00350EB26F
MHIHSHVFYINNLSKRVSKWAQSKMADSELHMECEEGDLAPWQHATDEEGEEVGKKMGGSERPGQALNQEEQTIILTLVPVSPSAQPLVQASTHSSPGSMLTSRPSPFLTQTSLTPLVLTPVSSSTQLTQLTNVPLINSNTPPSGQPIILSTQSLQAASTGQNNQLGMILNGQPITFLPGGQGAKMLGQPSSIVRSVGSIGAMKGLSAVQIPITLTYQSSSGYQTLSRVASGGISLPSTTPALHSTTPIITEVVSVGASDPAAAKTSSRPAHSPAQLPLQASSSRSPQASTRPITSPRPLKRLMGPAKPKLCQHCGVHYKIVNALRGFLCRCSDEIARSLKKLNSPKSYKPAKCKKSSSKRPRTSSRDSSSSDASSTSRPKKKKKKSGQREPGSKQKRVLVQTLLLPLGGPPKKRGRGRPRKGESLGSKGKGEEGAVRPVYAQAGTPILEAGALGKLIILVEDFYYGTDRTCRLTEQPERQPGWFKCIHCDKNFLNNIKLMNHMRRHVELSQQNDDVAANTSCQHCFRHFPTPYRLQGHLESVHGHYQSTSKCKICEWAFASEPVFLQHMKNFHRPGEMPYVCQVCRFRSSFYSEVMDHFQEAHSDTSHLQCPYCLRVFRSAANYQQHYSRHQKKTVFSCDSCRLHFLFAKERAEHKAQDHRTHLKPRQLEGLKPGTKVTIRTYAAADATHEVQGSLDHPPASPQVIEVPPGPQTSKSPQRKPPESQVELLVGFQKRSPVSERQNCVECAFSIPDFANHFPTYVCCSLCRFRTCCSRSYANHMISNHVTRKTTTKYETLYTSYPRESKMRCTSCGYSSTIGDMMANHLTDHPEHLACSFSDGPDLIDDPYPAPSSVPSSLVSGSFIPLHLSSSTQVSIKPLLSSSRPPTPAPSPPAFTIRLLGSLASIRDGVREGHPEPGKELPPQGKKALLEAVARYRSSAASSVSSSSSFSPLHKPLTVRQLSIVLYALCNGLPQASLRYGARPYAIRAWAQHQDRLRLLKEWRWCSDRIAEWVLSRREQQLPVNEDNLLQTASDALEEARDIADFYEWAVEFMLRHNLGLQASLASAVKPPLPRNVFESTRIFTRFVAKQVRAQGHKPGDMAALDELALFVDAGLLAEGSPAALQMFGEGEASLDVLLAACADGTLLSPMVFLRGELPASHEPIPGSVLVEARAEGFSDAQRLQLWLSRVWGQQERTSKRLLVMDTHRGHLANDFLAALSQTATIPAVIPIGCSSRLQPLEVCVGPVLREFLQARWRHLVAGGGGGVGLGLGGLAVKVAGWLGELVTCLGERPRILARSFNIVCTPPLEEVEDEAADITRVLTEVLIGSLEEEQLGEEEQEGEEEEDEEEDEEDEEGEENSSAGEPVQVKAEERGRDESAQEKQEETAGEEGGRKAAAWRAQCESPSLKGDMQAIRQVFERDSDLESFHGFEEKEVTPYMKTRSSASLQKNKP